MSYLRFFICFMILLSCDSSPHKKNKKSTLEVKKDNTKQKKIVLKRDIKDNTKKKKFKLTTDNAVPFFFKYAKEHSENKVRIHVPDYGDIDILLFDETPYHRANFIFLAKKKYFDGSCFHRVVPNFIIQGGSSDSYPVMKKRRDIGRYLLPPDTKKGFKHHRGIISMPSSDIDNPHSMASPYEFFIVQQSPGAYHLDGQYTAFGKVISNMDVIDKINKVETDRRDWPKQNIIIKSIRILN